MAQLPGHLLKVSISCKAENNDGNVKDITRCIKFHGRINCKFKGLLVYYNWCKSVISRRKYAIGIKTPRIYSCILISMCQPLIKCSILNHKMEFNNSSPNLSVRLRDLYKCNNVKKGISVRTTFLRLSADPRLSAPRKNALLTSFSWNEWPPQSRICFSCMHLEQYYAVFYCIQSYRRDLKTPKNNIYTENVTVLLQQLYSTGNRLNS